jgi:hypothetical protein
VPAVGLTWEEVRARRLRRSHLAERAPAERLIDVVRDVCGIHAQVMGSAELQLAARVEGITSAAVRDALWERRSLVKAWTIRGTLHLHPASELALWFGAQRAATRASPQERDGLEAWRDPAGVLHPRLEPDDVDTAQAAVWDALDGRCLLREELVQEVVKRVGPRPRERLLSGFAFFLHELCHGPPQGAKITLARPDQWIAGWREVLDERAALVEVCRRFLRTYGPARARDFGEWCRGRAFTGAPASALFDSLGNELEEIEVDGRRAFVLAGDTASPGPQRSVRLLPEYDVYVMGFREREHLLPPEVGEQVAAHGKGRYEGPAGTPFLLVDGVCAGIWSRKRTARRIELTVEPARRLSRAERADVDAEAERIGAFYGLEPRLVVAG